MPCPLLLEQLDVVALEELDELELLDELLEELLLEELLELDELPEEALSPPQAASSNIPLAALTKARCDTRSLSQCAKTIFPRQFVDLLAMPLSCDIALMLAPMLARWLGK